ncbi:aspartate aminotransferase [Sanguibacter gelidistatuariae]|uniref:Aspartate aminotransferase n=1 Tax=Sanguibacter gelidistatuariae TaxID=1814289 RepID=A0A1G6JAT3_9MICO|nr:aminotransferase class V-fold PLP-dependent enzyme [Sanguibacter gelidistatuariae]SDC15769.1 aspartate aminotransferase [Sanguibacter gelidistatuariae]
MTFDPTTLLDVPGLDAPFLARLEAQVAELLGVRDDVVIFQGEAILLMEAIAKNIAAPGATAINVVTGPYGAIFGDWMRVASAHVVDVTSSLDAVITVEAVRAALDAHPEATVLALAHAEAATGGTNPVAEIVALARSRGVVTVVDAVASIGAEQVTPARWGADICVIGPQKSLAGPAGISAASVTARAWDVIDANPGALSGSSLSLTDWRETWLRTDRSAIPGTPSVLESRALGAALDRVSAEGLDAVVARHTAAAHQARAGLEALGLRTWQRGPLGYASVVTIVAIPGDLDGAAFTRAAIDAGGGLVTAGNGSLLDKAVRINHTGRQATPEAVDRALAGLARAVAEVRGHQELVRMTSR